MTKTRRIIPLLHVRTVAPMPCLRNGPHNSILSNIPKFTVTTRKCMEGDDAIRYYVIQTILSLEASQPIVTRRQSFEILPSIRAHQRAAQSVELCIERRFSQFIQFRGSLIDALCPNADFIDCTYCDHLSHFFTTAWMQPWSILRFAPSIHLRKKIMVSFLNALVYQAQLRLSRHPTCETFRSISALLLSFLNDRVSFPISYDNRESI
uniref:AlNc14C7G965 protein n=1 Tax=Albugo laibachii Nc14 TaxID=890382 RepID=F0W1J7_9STRA|nr:AlNc14C7G965 [Albugo laibachii Nc14]|eukprot:CCA14926.1 AlNc14C7G965 [Albugo laibachii Nc14]